MALEGIQEGAISEPKTMEARASTSAEKRAQGTLELSTEAAFPAAGVSEQGLEKHLVGIAEVFSASDGA